MEVKLRSRRPLPWRRDLTILQRLGKVEELHLLGWSNYQIGASLNLSEATIRLDLKRIAELWLERLGDQLEAQKARAVAVYRRVQRAAWTEFGTVKDTSLNKSAYLNTIKAAEDSIAKVLGLTAERHEVTGKNGGPIEVNVDDARAKLAERIAAIAGRLEAAEAEEGDEGGGAGDSQG